MPCPSAILLAHPVSVSPSDTLTGACMQICMHFLCMRSHTPPCTLAIPLSSLSLGSRWWGVRLVAPSQLQATSPSAPPPTPHPQTPPHPSLCCWRAWVLKGEPQLVFPPTNPWLAAIGGTQSGVLILQLGEETLVNLPIACHWPWPGLFVSGTPLITPSTPSSVFPPSLPTQFL